jgi:ligand-binding sensor domain-containing protein
VVTTTCAAANASAEHPAALRPQVFTSTTQVEGLAATRDDVWVATRGGLERYDRQTFARRHVYTQLEGLTTTWVRSVHATAEGTVVAETAEARCELARSPDGSFERDFRCAESSHTSVATRLGEQHQGFRVTSALVVDGVRWVGTAGGGVYRDAQRLTPQGGLAGNHVTSLTMHRNELWVGTFNEGVCVRRASAFECPSAAFRMVNALISTPTGLYVAANEGLFVSADGRSFERVLGAPERSVNGLVMDGRFLYGTTPGALFRMSLDVGHATTLWWRPAGARSLQKVAVSPGLGGASLWLAAEDRGAIQVRLSGAQPTFKSFDRTSGLPSSWGIDVATCGDGAACLATLRDGVFRLESDGGFAQVPGTEGMWGLTCMQTERELWVGTQNGALRITAEGHSERLAALPDPRVHAFLATPWGVLVGTEGGLLLVPPRESYAVPPNAL